MKKISLILLTVIFFTAVFTSCKNSLSGKITVADGKEPFTLNQDMVSRLAALAVTGNCTLDEQQVKDNVLSALSALSENGNERAAVTVKDISLSAPKVATLKAPASFGKTERSANIQDFDEINLYLYTTNEGKDNEGWILASNDLRVGTIIAVVDGKYSEDYEEENPFMDIIKTGLEEHILETVYTWNSLTEEDIRAASPNEKYATAGNYYFDNWKMYDVKRLELFRYAWNQEYPFNSAITAMKKNNKYVAGCVPLVLAQIFSYHEWPSECSNKQYNELINNWSPARNWNGVYDWYLIQDGFSEYIDDGVKCVSYYEDYRVLKMRDFELNVSALLYDIGANCNAKYGTKEDRNGKLIGSTSVDDSLLKSCFRHYEYLADDIQSFSYNGAKESIQLDHPVYVRGSSGFSGHAWLVSGYADLSCDVYKINSDGINRTYLTRIRDGFVYCNVGWDKSSYNGYYLAGVFDFREGHVCVDHETLLSAEKDWYMDWKSSHSDRAASGDINLYYQHDVLMITNIRPIYE